MMNSKEFFQSVLDAQRAMEGIKKRRAHYMEIATNLSGMSEVFVRSSEKRSRVETAALELVELADQMDADAEVLVERLKLAESVISKLDKARHRQVLTLRYLEGRSWRTIADEMDYSDVKSAFRVHGWALLAAQPFVP